ncbi:MAG: phosphotransferase [Gammaproteobacteria bacterium]|nr:phosphotransferase [Gammaproteobacteria bacterium]
MPQRIACIKDWLKTDLHADIDRFEPASSDASFRRYFRVIFNNSVVQQVAGQSFIVMDAPPSKEAISPFIRIATCLEKTTVHVPHIYASNKTLGIILMSDLGSMAYLSLLNQSSGEEQANKLYTDALKSLIIMQKNQIYQTLNLPHYNAILLKSEMALLPDWYIKIHCQHTLSVENKSLLEQAMTSLIESAQEQPQVFVHRDYHSRNLMVVAKNNPGVIDFQDAVIGPITYDLVSLLRDSYISWSTDQVYTWVENYRQMLLAEGLLKEDNQAQFIRWFDLMGIQRQLKVVGIFCRLNYRDGKNNYLNDIPQTLDYLLDVCSRYHEFQPLAQLLLTLSTDNTNSKPPASIP